MKTYFPTIHLLRGIAATLVCLFHFTGYEEFRGQLFPTDSFIYQMGRFGVNGVFIFFVISGFVIPLAMSKDRFQLKYLHRFLWRRCIRIEIPYLVSILLVISVGILFALKNHTPFHFNIAQFLYHIVYVIPFTSYEWYNIIYWTLAIEFQFYITIGLLYYFLSSDKKIVMIIALLLFGALGMIITDNRLVFHYSPIFLQGIILFLIKTEKINPKIGSFLLSLFIIQTAYFHSIEISVFTTATLMAIHFLDINRSYTNRFGDISYSLYLTHGLVGGNLLYLLSRYVTTDFGKILLVIAAIFASLVFSYLYWWLIERPAKRLSGKVSITPLSE